MCLYNHLYIWGEKYLPRGIFCNGWILINQKKMSKSTGNFYTLEEFCIKYSSDATRLSLAMAGDTIENANLETSEADNAILKLTNLEKAIE